VLEVVISLVGFVVVDVCSSLQVKLIYAYRRWRQFLG
jgi:hypothetical protein